MTSFSLRADLKRQCRRCPNMPVTIQREGWVLAVHPRNGARLVATCCTQCHGFSAAILPATEASRALPAGDGERWNRHAPPWLRVEE